ncbi:DUF484 family protein [Marinicellulosiphila megalodicopiae]|uniref:DUF484 family protein n=1 Tax=Marinicellulosiphila megalodicopiae TaxID=2724896 RepID=UPI003BAEF319
MADYDAVIQKINKSKVKMDEQAVAEYLKTHPNFFERHLDVLAEMKLKHPSGNAVSLLERQNTMLRNDALDSKHKLAQLIIVAKRNEALFENIKYTLLELIEQNDLNSLCGELNHCLTTQFKTDSVRVFLFNKQGNMEDNWLWVDRNLLQEYMPTLLVTDSCQCGEFDEDKRMFLFGDSKVSSAAIAPLISEDGEALGLIALGSNQNDYFTQKMDTTFLKFLAQSVARLIYKFV